MNRRQILTGIVSLPFVNLLSAKGGDSGVVDQPRDYLEPYVFRWAEQNIHIRDIATHNYNKIKLTPIQKEMLMEMMTPSLDTNKRVYLCEHGRQAGSSTIQAIYALFLALHDVNRTIRIVCHGQNTAKALYRITLDMVMQMPEFTPMIYHSDNVICFRNGGTIFFSSHKNDYVRGATLTDVIIDNYYYCQTKSEFLAYLIPTIRSMKNPTNIIIMGTPPELEPKFINWEQFEKEYQINKKIKHSRYISYDELKNLYS